MKFRHLALVLIVAVLGLSAPSRAALPEKVTLTVPAKLEIMRGDRVSGTVELRAGQELALLALDGDYALVRFRSLNGRVRIAQTDLPAEALTPVPTAAPPPVPAATATAATHVEPAATRAPPLAPHEPVNAIERALAGKLVSFAGGTMQPYDGARLAGVKFYAIYFSASWCGPCREFTPELVDAYGKIREIYPEFQVVLVNLDHSPAEMTAYMRDDRMAWPALRWDAYQSTGDIVHYCGRGIPCLVLVDENGEVLSDSFRWGQYVGAETVLDDTWKILRTYRQKHPRTRM